MAKTGSNPDFNIEHADWVRDAQKDNFVALIKIIKDKEKRRRERIISRDEKLHGK